MLYPVAMTQLEEGNVEIEVPDLPGCRCRSVSVENGVIDIKKSINDHLMILAEYGEKIPEPSSIFSLKEKGETDQNIWAFVEIDITPYLGKSQKINVTLPELLIKQIDDRVAKSERYKSRSGFIAIACYAELKKDD
ncbi:MAG: HicB family protein [Colwelliaceae bacterium]|nr:HicB family protein [Colwelliaceae bacterium]|tara:strand:+ start:573 stop:980 length:408 start_codon:yes stop_codon:yes gene_type:complete